MIRHGVDYQAMPGTAVEVPCADVEIDFGIEWNSAGRIVAQFFGFVWAVDDPGGRLS